MKKVITVDDSRTIREMVSFILTQNDFEVMQAEDGADALDKLKDATPDVIITDLNMPVMNGFELIKHLRADSRFAYTPILMLTTESDNEKKQAGKQAGATGWIVKPFRPEKLLQVVNKVVN